MNGFSETSVLELSRYIVRNPVAAGMVDDVGDWHWSSYQATAGEITALKILALTADQLMRMVQ
ncbi:MAG: hypothetical protein R8M38_07470 [Mariprofundaceae bacterium]